MPISQLADAVPVTDLVATSDGSGRHAAQIADTDTLSPAGTALSSLTEPIGPADDDSSVASGLLA